MIPREAAEAAIAALGAVNPEALRLAEAVSLAVHVDKRLLRTARLALTRAGPEAEADLHFSRLVRDAAPSGLVFHPEAAFLLRRRLQADPDRLARAWQVVSARHPQLPATLRTEEQLQWHALRGDAETVRDLLRACIGTMVEQGRPGFAAWAIDAVARMDPAARGLDEYRMLGLGAALRTGASQRQVADLADDRLAEWLAWLAPPAADRVKVGLAMVQGEEGFGVEFGPASDPRYRHRIELPRRFPQVLELRDAATDRVQAVTLREQAVVFVPTEAAEIVITAEDGSRRRLRHETKPRFIREDRLPRVHLEYEVNTFGARQKVSLPFVLGAMADLCGHNRKDRQPLEARDFLEFTAANFDARMAGIAPTVRLQVADVLGGGDRLDLKLTFRSMADFQPDALVEAVPQLAAVLRLRQQVRDLMAFMDGKEPLERAVEVVLSDPVRLLPLAGRNLSIPGAISVQAAWGDIRRKIAGGRLVAAMERYAELIEPEDQLARREQLRNRLRAILLLGACGQKSAEERLLQKTIQDIESFDQAGTGLHARLLRHLGELALAKARPDAAAEAEMLLREAMEIAQKVHGPKANETGWLMLLVAEALLAGDKPQAAQPFLASVEALLDEKAILDQRLAVRVAIGLAEMHLRRGAIEPARMAIGKVAWAAVAVFGSDSSIVSDMLGLVKSPKSARITPEQARRRAGQWRRHLDGRGTGEVFFQGADAAALTLRDHLQRVLPNVRSERQDRIMEGVEALCSVLADFPEIMDQRAFRACEAAIDLIDRHLSDQLRLILLNPDFRRLEKTWLGLHYLARNLPVAPDIKLRVLDISRDELPLALAGAGSTFRRSPLFRKIYEAEFGQLGGQPYGAVVCDFAFSGEPADIDVLDGLARLGQLAQVPFIAAAAPALAGQRSWAELDGAGSLDHALERQGHRAWQALLERPESRYLVLTMPDMVGRPAYGNRSAPVASFAFEEGEGKPLTVSAAWGLGLRLAESFQAHGWFARIHGVETGGTLAGLPTARFASDEEPRPTEVLISDRQEAELVRAGLMPLLARRGTADATFISAPTLHRPAIFDDVEATASARLAARLPYVMAFSRFAHYVMCLCRDHEGLGQGATVRELAQAIQLWLDQHVAEDVGPDDVQGQARFPLKVARFEATYGEGGPGKFRFNLLLLPRFQFPGPDVAMSADLLPPFGDDP